jgi:hypothetical protein
MKAEHAAVVSGKRYIFGSGPRLKGHCVYAHRMSIGVAYLFGLGAGHADNDERDEGEESLQSGAFLLVMLSPSHLAFLLQKLQHFPKITLVYILGDDTACNTDHYQYGAQDHSDPARNRVPYNKKWINAENPQRK